MALFRRPVVRFFIWVALLVAVAAVTVAAGLAWWWIALIELAAWLLVTIAERAMWRRSVAQPAPDAPAPEPEPDAADGAGDAETVVLVPAAVEAAPMPVSTGRRIMRPRAAQVPALRSQVRWNVWSLEKLADEHPEREELEFLVVSLRDFANADGQLPADFDALVRESFGELLPG